MLQRMARSFLGLNGSNSPVAAFTRSKKGKPILCPFAEEKKEHGEKPESLPQWDFNISHQGDFTVLAAEKGKKSR